MEILVIVFMLPPYPGLIDAVSGLGGTATIGKDVAEFTVPVFPAALSDGRQYNHVDARNDAEESPCCTVMLIARFDAIVVTTFVQAIGMESGRSDGGTFHQQEALVMLHPIERASLNGQNKEQKKNE